MKKILFTTTALVASAMISSAAMADGMTFKRYSSSMKSSSMSSANQLQSTRYLQQNDMMGASAFKATVGGYANWMVGYADNGVLFDSSTGEYVNTNEFDVMGDAQVHFDFAASLKNGMKIGVKSQLITDTTSDAGEIDQAYMYIESKYGKIMVGRHDNVNEQLMFGAIDLGPLDIQESELNRWVVNPVSDGFEESTTYFTGDANLTKISYITPNFSGFQAGLTYAPRGSYKKDNVAYFGLGDYAWDATTLTAAYKTMIDGIGYGISAGYGFNSIAEKAYIPDSSNTITKFNVGGRIAYKGLSVSAAFKDIDNNLGSTTVWDAGIAYETGPYGVSLSYISTDGDMSEIQTMLLSGVYSMAAGVDAFATFGWADYKHGNNSLKNDGFALIGGMMLSF